MKKEITSVKQDINLVNDKIESVKEEMKKDMSSVKENINSV